MTERVFSPPFSESLIDIIGDKGNRDRKIVEAVEKYGYRQSEIARHLGMHYSTVSNSLRRKGPAPKG